MSKRQSIMETRSFRGKEICVAFNAAHDGFLGQTQSSFFNYMCPSFVKSFPLLATVVLLGRYVAHALGFPYKR